MRVDFNKGVTMALRNVRAKIGRHNKKSLNIFSYSLPPENELTDSYKKYLTHDFQPDDPFSNPRNLFDDSNIKDREWFKITKEYLSRNR